VLGPTEDHDVRPQPGVRSQNPVVAVTMDARRRDELGESVKEFEGREQQLGATMDVGFGEAVEKAALGRREGGGGFEGVQPLERERRARTISDEALDARTVFTLDAHGRVDAEPARALPREHAGGVEFGEESVAAEVAEDSSLEGGFELADVIGRQLEGLVEVEAHLAASLAACTNTPSRTTRW
jgi:hypothetical protein